MSSWKVVVMLLGSLLAVAGHAFANVAAGDALPEVSLAPLAGGKPVPYLAKGQATVFVFFTAGQEFSKRGIADLTAVQEDLAGQPVSFVAIFSDRQPLDEAKALVKESGFSGLALVDAGDALYGRLGAALTPVTGIAGADHKLTAYIAFRKINYAADIRAWAQRTLGLISEEQLQLVLNPPAATQGGPVQVARRYVKLGERQLASGSFEGALASSEKAIASDAELGTAHALKAAALAGLGRCKGAAPELEVALAKDPADASALATKQRCAGGGAVETALDGGATTAP